MENSLKDLLLVSQDEESCFLITKKAWEDHKKYVLESFRSETSLEESLEELRDYIDSFKIQFLDIKSLRHYTQNCKLEINQTHEIKSFMGDIMRF